MNIADVILSQGADSAPAIFYDPVAVTYAELRQQVSHLANQLLVRGHTQGDRVGLFCENSPFFVTAYLGIIRAGLVAVPFQTEMTEQAFAAMISEAEIREIYVSKRFLDRIRPWAAKLPVTLIEESCPALAIRSSKSAVQSRPLSNIPMDPQTHLAALMFTSGSTGPPKGVMVTHRNIECNSRDIIAYMGLRSDDRVMVVLPFHYCFGLSLLHTHLMAGASLVLNNDFRLYPERVVQEMQQKECTGFAGVPSTYQILLRKSRFRQMSFPKLRWLQQAGGKLPNPCITEILKSFPQVRYFLMYGQTEATARLSYLPPERLADKLGSIGKGLPSTRLEVLKADGSRVVAGSEQVGEIVASGDNVSPGYWNDPLETAKFFRNEKLHTGDLARVDKDGFIFIVERERDMIKSGGNRVSAKEIEDVIAELSEIVEVAVVGAPHELLGEVVRAFVVAAPGATVTTRQIQAHCRKHLPPYKIPENVMVLKTLPRNGAGKVMKQELRIMMGHFSDDEHRDHGTI